jgi:hypothetical protein
MTVIYHPEVLQGSDEWHALRCGVLTASEMRHILTPTLKLADNDKTRAHVWEIAAQRISRYTEPTYIGDEMLRGHEDEIEAYILYDKHFGATEACGFITNDSLGFPIGYSPDRLVGDGGLLECKSRRQRFQVEAFATGKVPQEHVIQCQTGLWVTGRAWLDYVSYSGGLPMAVIRVEPDPLVFEAIEQASTAFEAKVRAVMQDYQRGLSTIRNVPTERRIIEEIY